MSSSGINRNTIYYNILNFQLSDNAHESRLKEVIEKYLRNNNYSLGGTEVHAAEELMDRLNVSGTSILHNTCVKNI